MATVAEAVSRAFGAEKMNVELLGNGDAHLHWHLFPRRDGDLEGYGNQGRGPVWWYPMEKMYDEANCPSQEELEELKSRLKRKWTNDPKIWLTQILHRYRLRKSGMSFRPVESRSKGIPLFFVHEPLTGAFPEQVL